MRTGDLPENLEIAYLGNGTALLELLDRTTNRSFDTVEVAVDDIAATSAAITAWRSLPTERGGSRLAVRPQRDAQASGAYTAYIRTGAYTGAGPFGIAQEALQPLVDAALADDADDAAARDLAVGIRDHFHAVRSVAAVRAADPQHIALLKGYLARLCAITEARSGPARDETDSLIERESFIGIAEDPELRALHEAIAAEREFLYQWSMSVSHTGEPQTVAPRVPPII